MSNKKAYDIFISYRRDGGLDFARSIAYYLRIEGFQCFFDQRELKTGQFNQQIYEAIENSKYFLSVLTPGALDRCANPDDWVRKEIEHAIQKGVQIIPVAVRGERLAFPESLPQSLAMLKTAQASFIDRETDFEETIVKMLREQLKGLSSMTALQHRGVRRQAEKVFLKKASRFKDNDGEIDDKERLELERLASACGISRNRLEELVERVESAAEKRARILKWMKVHPLFVALIGVACIGLLSLLAILAKAAIFPPGSGQSEAVISEDGSQDASGKGAGRDRNNRTRDINSAAEELAKLDSSHRYYAEQDFRGSLSSTTRTTPRLDQVGRRIADEYVAAAEEGRKLHSLGMQGSELVQSRPDLVMKFADIRTRVEADMKQLINDNRHEEALNYFNSAKKAFQMLMMQTLDRPSFSEGNGNRKRVRGS